MESLRDRQKDGIDTHGETENVERSSELDRQMERKIMWRVTQRNG